MQLADSRSDLRFRATFSQVRKRLNAKQITDTSHLGHSRTWPGFSNLGRHSRRKVATSCEVNARIPHTLRLPCWELANRKALSTSKDSSLKFAAPNSETRMARPLAYQTSRSAS